MIWLWIGLPLLFLLGLFMNAIKDMRKLEKQLSKYDIKPRYVDDDEDDWPKHNSTSQTDSSSHLADQSTEEKDKEEQTHPSEQR